MITNNISRAVGLACAIATETLRVYADSDRKVSLRYIQRDAENFSKFIEEGSWTVVITERSSEGNPSQGQNGRTVQHGRHTATQ